mgnify:CR=1 FL=1
MNRWLLTNISIYSGCFCVLEAASATVAREFWSWKVQFIVNQPFAVCLSTRFPQSRKNADKSLCSNVRILYRVIPINHSLHKCVAVSLRWGIKIALAGANGGYWTAGMMKWMFETDWGVELSTEGKIALLDPFLFPALSLCPECWAMQPQNSLQKRNVSSRCWS